MHQRLKATILLAAPVLITGWFVQDGGLQNGLNRLGYEAAMAAFFAGYSVVLATAGLLRRKQPGVAAANWRLAGWSGTALLVWIIAATVYEA